MLTAWVFIFKSHQMNTEWFHTFTFHYISHISYLTHTLSLSLSFLLQPFNFYRSCIFTFSHSVTQYPTAPCTNKCKNVVTFFLFIVFTEFRLLCTPHWIVYTLKAQSRKHSQENIFNGALKKIRYWIVLLEAISFSC